MPGYDIERLMSNAWVLDDQICYAYKQPDDVLGGRKSHFRLQTLLTEGADFFQTRFRLHKKVYGHAVAKSYEFMYVDALMAADEYFGIADSVYDPEVYVTMTDGIFDTIRTMSRTVPELEKAAAILKKIDQRQHYRHVDAMVIPPRLRSKITKDVVTERAVASFRPSAGFKEEEIIVDFLRQSYSPLGDRNPLENVKFYKRNEDIAVTINPETFSNVLPSVFEDLRVRCFLRSPDRQRTAELQEIFRAYLHDLTRGLGESMDNEAMELFTTERRRESMVLPNQLLTAGFGDSSPRKRRLFGEREWDGDSTPNSSPERRPSDRKKMAFGTPLEKDNDW